MAKVSSVQTLQRIVRELDGAIWTPETLEAIAQHLRAGGYAIREPSEPGEDRP